MNESATMLEEGRLAFLRRDWGEAYALLQAADHESSLAPEDLHRLAMSAHLIGRDLDSTAVWTRAHTDFLHRDDVAQAARCAYWLASLALMIDGDPARSAGWQARGQRLLDDAGLDCVERGYLVLPVAVRCLFQGDLEQALMGFEQVASFAERFRDPDLSMLGRLGKGQVLIRSGKIDEGMALLDEAMVAVTAGEASPVFAGLAYCAAIEDCQLTFDMRRAHSWTEALDRWSSAQPGLVPYRRQCLVHRANILRFHGAWTEAQAEAARACELVSQVADRQSTGDAWYQRAEIHRTRGEFVKAEEAYREASRMGRTPNPGLALLRMAQGQAGAALASIRRELGEGGERRSRALLLAACVDVLLACGEVDEARRAAEALSDIATELNMPPLLKAMTLHAQGALALANGDPRGALLSLRPAWKAWFDLDAPYEAARVRVLIGRCCRELGDRETAALEFDAAAQIFLQLGATPDYRSVIALTGPAQSSSHGLTGREIEVLRLIVAGKTNREIAADLTLSDHTARRHVQNIFAKLGVSSRAAATAFALQHDLT